jgi:hypothetical protein
VKAWIRLLDGEMGAMLWSMQTKAWIRLLAGEMGTMKWSMQAKAWIGLLAGEMTIFSPTIWISET